MARNDSNAEDWSTANPVASPGGLQKRNVDLDRAQTLVRRGLDLAGQIPLTKSLGAQWRLSTSRGYGPEEDYDPEEAEDALDPDAYYSNSLFIASDGSLWAWGSNYNGQLGLGHRTACDQPCRVGNGSSWQTVAAAPDSAFATSAEGALWIWGAIGDPKTDDLDPPVPVRFGSSQDWAVVVSGDSHWLALKQDGTLWAWGTNDDGRLGLGHRYGQSSPEQVGIDGDWCSLACGDYHSLALKRDGSLWAWGNNFNGQLGIGSQEERDPCDRPQRISGDGWRSAAAGSIHSLAIREDGTLWAWGWNGRGELGFGDCERRYRAGRVGGDTDWASAAAGDMHSAAIKSDGTLWTWGSNLSGQLGMGDRLDRHEPQQVGTESDWEIVACGPDHTVATKNDGSVWTWGCFERQLCRELPILVGRPR